MARIGGRGYARAGTGGVRKVIASIVIALVAAGCDAAPGRLPKSEPNLLVRESPTPFNEVSAGPVSALIPDRWHPELASADGGLQEGLIASPDPKRWGRIDGSVEGLAAVWVDVAHIGVPSDYYYLAATGPVLERLTHSADCRPTERQVIVDHRPSYISGPHGSPGDYVARGRGTCSVGGTPTRWAYFVAAPGYGPVRKVGIPNSGLYVVVAVLPDSREAHGMLDKLLRGTHFGGAGVADFIAAARR